MHGILIIGGGFAGVWSAAAGVVAAGDTDLPVRLVSQGDDLVIDRGSTKPIRRGCGCRWTGSSTRSVSGGSPPP